MENNEKNVVIQEIEETLKMISNLQKELEEEKTNEEDEQNG